LYAYRCTECGHRFEKIQNFSAEPELECPVCHGVLERPLTAPRLHFKGAGWYVNDYAPKSTAPASESGAESGAKPDSKSDSKSEKEGATAESKNPSTASESTASAPAAAPAASPASTAGTSS
jgi:putative FmdB family regulatory protein